MFRCMLGLVRGRVYYNLLNWYRLLALLPGYQFNRAFHGTDDGRAREPRPRTSAARCRRERPAHRLRDAARLAGTLWGPGGRLLWVSSRRIRGFPSTGSTRPWGRAGPTSPRLRPDELVGAITASWSGNLLTRWDAPLVNDFFAMVFYGLLRQPDRNAGAATRRARCRTICCAARAG